MNRQGTYRLENGQLVFDTEANLLGYNQFVDQVHALSDEHEAWLKGAQQLESKVANSRKMRRFSENFRSLGL
ncbi:MAG: hypothetical protein IPH59_05740 [bacterium]|nr:hypothetical protein [bacterium]